MDKREIIKRMGEIQQQCEHKDSCNCFEWTDLILDILKGAKHVKEDTGAGSTG